MILIVLNQSWVVTQFGWTEPMVLVNKNQTGTGSGTEIRTFENKFFGKKKVWNQGLTGC
jgi:hypothetical protein